MPQRIEADFTRRYRFLSVSLVSPPRDSLNVREHCFRNFETLVFGLLDPSSIRLNKRLQKYDQGDQVFPKTLMDRSSGLLFTPDILKETSNLVRYVSDPLRSQAARMLSVLVDDADERFVESRRAIERTEYQRLGLADCVMLLLAESSATLLTDDLSLYLAEKSAGYDAIDFTQLRDPSLNG